MLFFVDLLLVGEILQPRAQQEFGDIVVNCTIGINK